MAQFNHQLNAIKVVEVGLYEGLSIDIIRNVGLMRELQPTIRPIPPELELLPNGLPYVLTRQTPNHMALTAGVVQHLDGVDLDEFVFNFYQDDGFHGDVQTISSNLTHEDARNERFETFKESMAEHYLNDCINSSVARDLHVEDTAFNVGVSLRSDEDYTSFVNKSNEDLINEFRDVMEEFHTNCTSICMQRSRNEPLSPILNAVAWNVTALPFTSTQMKTDSVLAGIDYGTSQRDKQGIVNKLTEKLMRFRPFATPTELQILQNAVLYDNNAEVAAYCISREELEHTAFGPLRIKMHAASHVNTIMKSLRGALYDNFAGIRSVLPHFQSPQGSTAASPSFRHQNISDFIEEFIQNRIQQLKLVRPEDSTNISEGCWSILRQEMRSGVQRTWFTNYHIISGLQNRVKVRLTKDKNCDMVENASNFAICHRRLYKGRHFEQQYGIPADVFQACRSYLESGLYKKMADSVAPVIRTYQTIRRSCCWGSLVNLRNAGILKIEFLLEDGSWNLEKPRPKWKLQKGCTSDRNYNSDAPDHFHSNPPPPPPNTHFRHLFSDIEYGLWQPELSAYFYDSLEDPDFRKFLFHDLNQSTEDKAINIAKRRINAFCKIPANSLPPWNGELRPTLIVVNCFQDYQQYEARSYGMDELGNLREIAHETIRFHEKDISTDEELQPNAENIYFLNWIESLGTKFETLKYDSHGLAYKTVHRKKILLINKPNTKMESLQRMIAIKGNVSIKDVKLLAYNYVDAFTRCASPEFPYEAEFMTAVRMYINALFEMARFCHYVLGYSFGKNFHMDESKRELIELVFAKYSLCDPRRFYQSIKQQYQKFLLTSNFRPEHIFDAVSTESLHSEAPVFLLGCMPGCNQVFARSVMTYIFRAAANNMLTVQGPLNDGVLLPDQPVLSDLWNCVVHFGKKGIKEFLEMPDLMADIVLTLMRVPETLNSLNDTFLSVSTINYIMQETEALSQQHPNVPREDLLPFLPEGHILHERSFFVKELVSTSKGVSDRHRKRLEPHALYNSLLYASRCLQNTCNLKFRSKHILDWELFLDITETRIYGIVAQQIAASIGWYNKTGVEITPLRFSVDHLKLIMFVIKSYLDFLTNDNRRVTSFFYSEVVLIPPTESETGIVGSIPGTSKKAMKKKAKEDLNKLKAMSHLFEAKMELRRFWTIIGDPQLLEDNLIMRSTPGKLLVRHFNFKKNLFRQTSVFSEKSVPFWLISKSNGSILLDVFVHVKRPRFGEPYNIRNMSKPIPDETDKENTETIAFPAIAPVIIAELPPLGSGTNHFYGQCDSNETELKITCPYGEALGQFEI